MARRVRLAWFAAMACGAAQLGSVAAAPPAEPELPSIASVMVRGKKVLEDAIRAAVPARAPGTPAPLVVLVVDVTKHVVKRGEVLRKAIARLDRDEDFAREIRLAPLGRTPGAAAKNLDELNRDVAELLAKETPAANTFAALKTSLAVLHEPANVVYLCDWRFEDDQGVDAFAEDLGKRGLVVSIVGTEAAFGRAWTDGTIDPAARLGGNFGDYYPEIGRSPFGKADPAAPWHGGETAYPSIPYRFHSYFWDTEFQPPSKPLDLGGLLPKGFLPKDGKPDADDPDAPPSPPDAPGKDGPAGDDGTPEDPDEPEELGERLGETPDRFDPERIRKYPIPSAFGPYGLVRLAAKTGGRYVLWSWNPGGRARVTYDYGRCNLFAPDLRSRERILAEIATDPLAKATIEAWHALIPGGIVEHTPPLDKDAKSPKSIDVVYGPSEFDLTWETFAQWKGFRRALAKAQPAAAAAQKLLHAALDAAKDTEGDVARRRLAEARLFSHEVDVIVFELRELDLATANVKPELWRTMPKGKTPGAGSRWFIVGKGSPLADFGGAVTLDADSKPLDAAAGEAIRVARAEHLERYKGTPFAAQVDLADVSTFRVVEWEVGKPFSRGGMPSESGGGKGGPPVTPPPGGSSGGGGPTTGK